MTRTRLLLAGALCALGAAAMAQPGPPPVEPWIPPPPGQPVEPKPPNAKGQAPAFPGQTRAPYRPSNVEFEVVKVADFLENPWGLAFLPDGRMLVTEKNGRLRIVGTDGKLSPPVGKLPSVDARQGGALMDVAVDPDYAANGWIYWAYAEPHGDGASATVARARLVANPNRLEDIQIIFRQLPVIEAPRSFGTRLVFARDGTLLIGTGDRDFPEFRHLTQPLDTTIGKVVRINRDGTVPRDNPFVSTPGARPEIYAVGFRNVLGAALHPQTGKLWTNENGPMGGDELNVVEPGRNYGWPVISYGQEYSGAKIGEGTQKEGMQQPVYYWDPVVAASGMAFYTADLFPAWKGSLFIGSLRQRHLIRLELDGEKVVGEERLLSDEGERIRDVRQGPDGALYILTDSARARLIKLVPKAAAAP